MMRKFFLTCALMLPLCAHAVGGAGIVGVVNDDAITASDLLGRQKLMIGSSGLPPTPEVFAKTRDATLSSLVDERLMMQEAKRDKITVSDADIAKGFDIIAKQNNLSGDQLKSMMIQAGIPEKTMHDEIEAQTAWGGVISHKIRPTVDVTDFETDDQIARLHADIGKTQYLVADITLPVRTPQDEAAAQQLADRIELEIRQNHAPFDKVATQFSQAPGATHGGDLGWVQEGELPSALDQALAGMEENSMSAPIFAGGAYHILMLRKKQTLTEATMPSRDEVREKIGLAKLDRAQKHLLQQLRASAFIEKR